MTTLLFWLGIAMMLLGTGLLLLTEISRAVGGMVAIACLLAVGFLVSAGAKIVWFIGKT
ncbi:hypothetical protein [Ferrimonas balearica]|uniref:hypothetical protein n=1 Tax=Ferrimonas balearica TaxID=44012 RepID=UPI001C9A00F7|nr:hypothetical protein [Ferrimonas balearica]MBY5991843.1 hypothetical protein [Ferrimonas balearica]